MRAMSGSSRQPHVDQVGLPAEHPSLPLHRQCMVCSPSIAITDLTKMPYGGGDAIYDTPSQGAFKPCASEIPLMDSGAHMPSLYYTPPTSLQHLAASNVQQPNVGNYLMYGQPQARANSVGAHSNPYNLGAVASQQYAGDIYPFLDSAAQRPRSSSAHSALTPLSSSEPILPTDLRDAKGTQYHFDTFLGKGGFGNVYLVHSATRDQQFAIKVIQKSRFRKPTHRTKVIREIDLNSRMAHPNIVACHASFEDPNNMYLVLEYCEHDSLMTLLKNRVTITEPEARIYLRQICRAVIYMTEDKAVMHCDLKLGNIYLDGRMCIKIGDFGLALDITASLEPKRGMCGTPNYLAPELLENSSPSLGSECWAIGCALYALLCGKPPFEASDVPSTYARVKAGKYQLPRHLSKEASSLIRL